MGRLAATARHADGDIMQSIEKNQVRFNMSPQLVSIFRNTAEGFRSNLLEAAR